MSRIEALESAEWVQVAVAMRILGISRETVEQMMFKHRTLSYRELPGVRGRRVCLDEVMEISRKSIKPSKQARTGA